MPDKSGGLLGGLTALIDKGRATDVICLDLSKACAAVLDDILVSKLETWI